MSKKIKTSRPADRIWKFFASVKLSVIVLLLLAATSIIGTLIPQNGSEAFYVQKYGEVFSRLFSALNFFDLYHSWWFLMIIGLLAVNIIICSIERLSSTWKIIFPKKISYNLERFQRQKSRVNIEVLNQVDQLESRLEALVSSAAGNVVKEETKTGFVLFSEKGRWTRIGVYIVHLSILILLIGAVIGSVAGYKGFVAIPEGATQEILIKTKTSKNEKPVFSVRCNRFEVKFYDTGQPEEFKSNLTIIEDGKESFTTDIIVNKPLRYKGISLYQSSYGTDAVKAVELTVTSQASGMVYKKTVNLKEPFDLPENGGRFVLEAFVPGYNFRGHNLGESLVGTLSRVHTPKAGEALEQGAVPGEPHDHDLTVVLPVRFPTFDRMRRGNFVFEAASYQKVYYTGLQVTRDPGVWYVYTGFMLMIVGCWVTFFMSHQSLCVEVKSRSRNAESVMVSGIANRNPQSMKMKMTRLAQKIKEFK